MTTLSGWTRHAGALFCAGLIAGAFTVSSAYAADDTKTVVIDNFSFSPAVVQVPAGSTITWENHDDMPHTITSTEKPRTLASPAIDSGEHYTASFPKPGTYTYFCSLHPRMTGTVIVK